LASGKLLHKKNQAVRSANTHSPILVRSGGGIASS
jgi:hypothetical protein